MGRVRPLHIMKLVESRRTGGDGAFAVEDAAGEEESALTERDWRADEDIATETARRWARDGDGSVERCTRRQRRRGKEHKALIPR